MTTQVRNPELVNLLKADFINCWIPVAQSVLTAPAATVTFSGLPQNYRAMVLLTQARTDRAAENDRVVWRANADAGNNYDTVLADFDANNASWSGGIIAGTSAYAVEVEGGNSRANNFGSGICWWIGYALADREKVSVSPISARFGDASALADLLVWFTAGRWRNTAAITSLTFFSVWGSNLVAGSRFALYGVL